MIKNTTILILVAATFLFLISFGLNQHEIYECHKWSDQSKEYAQYYFTQWQIDQCETHKIQLN